MSNLKIVIGLLERALKVLKSMEKADLVERPGKRKYNGHAETVDRLYKPSARLSNGG